MQGKAILFLKANIIIGLVLAVLGCSLNDKKIFQDENGLLEGYDPVAYFLENQAVLGDKQFSLLSKEGTWYFSSADNKQLFSQNPDKYKPQYGGYCAYAMTFGLVVSSDPHAFSIINDKLYLNYSLSVREKWLKKKEQYIVEADDNWNKKQ
ncbi:MAG: hypothetical protein ACI9ES_003530 [Oceanospirillaceae bacterium]|jgi:hypothetical protein